MNNSKHLSVLTAQQAVLKAIKPGYVEKINVTKSSGFVLADSIKSPMHSPTFNNSAMDGYALRFNDFLNGRKIEIVGESSAGRGFSANLNAGQSIRIFTGAEIPKGADTVVMQEKITVENNKLLICDNLLKKGSNIRLEGSQIKKNNIALLKNHLINAASIGFLTSLGIETVKVYAKPVVTIIVTGDELVPAGKPLSGSKIYESNAAALQVALEKEGIKTIFIKRSKDNFKSTHKTFRKACLNSDFILFTGGISVGDYDFVEAVLNSEKVVKVFHGVKQKPGKPLYFGSKDRKFIFGLPGNPASVLTCFYEFVLPALRKFQNHQEPILPVLKLPLINSFTKKPGLTVFLKAYTDFNSVSVLEGQESYIMKSFSEANCFVVLGEETTELQPGALVEIHVFG